MGTPLRKMEHLDPRDITKYASSHGLTATEKEVKRREAIPALTPQHRNAIKRVVKEAEDSMSLDQVFDKVVKRRKCGCMIDTMAGVFCQCAAEEANHELLVAVNTHLKKLVADREIKKIGMRFVSYEVFNSWDSDRIFQEAHRR